MQQKYCTNKCYIGSQMRCHDINLQEKYAPACLAEKDADFSSGPGQTGWVGLNFSFFTFPFLRISFFTFSYVGISFFTLPFVAISFFTFIFVGISFRFMVGELLQRTGLTLLRSCWSWRCHSISWMSDILNFNCFDQCQIF